MESFKNIDLITYLCVYLLLNSNLNEKASALTFKDQYLSGLKNYIRKSVLHIPAMAESW